MERRNFLAACPGLFILPHHRKVKDVPTLPLSDILSFELQFDKDNHKPIKEHTPKLILKYKGYERHLILTHFYVTPHYHSQATQHFRFPNILWSIIEHKIISRPIYRQDKERVGGAHFDGEYFFIFTPDYNIVNLEGHLNVFRVLKEEKIKKLNGKET
jgi:hypothetical protein